MLTVIKYTLHGFRKETEKIMKKMRVMVIKYGYAVVEVDTEREALELTHDMSDSDFDWSDFDEAQVVGDDVD